MDEAAAASFVWSLVKEVGRLLDQEHPPFHIDPASEPLNSLCGQVIMIFSQKDQDELYKKVVLQLLLSRDSQQSIADLSNAFHRAYTHLLSHELRKRLPEECLDALAELEQESAATLVSAHQISEIYREMFLRLQQFAFAMIDDRLRAICLMVYRARLTILRSIAVCIRDICGIYKRLSSEQNVKAAPQVQILTDCFQFSARIRAFRRDMASLTERLGLSGDGNPAHHQPRRSRGRAHGQDLASGPSLLLDKVLSVSLRDPLARNVAATLPIELLVASLSHRELFGKLQRDSVYAEVLRAASLSQCLESFSAAGQAGKFWQALFRAAVEYLSAIGMPGERSTYTGLYSEVLRLYVFLFDLYEFWTCLLHREEPRMGEEFHALLSSIQTPFGLALGRVAGRLPDVLPGAVPALEVFRTFCGRVHSICAVFDHLLGLGQEEPEQGRKTELWGSVFPDLRVATREFARKLVKEECAKQAALLDPPPRFGIFRNAASYQLTFVTETTLVLHFPPENVDSSKMEACLSLYGDMRRAGSQRGCLQALDVVMRGEGCPERVSTASLLEYSAKSCADSQNASVHIDEEGNLSSCFGLYPKTRAMTYAELFGECSVQLVSLASLSLLQSLVTLSTLARCVPRKDLVEGVIYTRQSVLYYVAKVFGVPVPRSFPRALDPLSALFDALVGAMEDSRRDILVARGEWDEGPSAPHSPVVRSPSHSSLPQARSQALSPTSRALGRAGLGAMDVRAAIYTSVELFSSRLPDDLLSLIGLYCLLSQERTVQRILLEDMPFDRAGEKNEAWSAVASVLSCKFRMLREMCGFCVTKWFDFGSAFSLIFGTVGRRYESSAGDPDATELPDLVLTAVSRILGAVSSIRLNDQVTGAYVFYAPIGDLTLPAGPSGAPVGGQERKGEPFYGPLQVEFWKAIYREICHYYTQSLSRVRRKTRQGGLRALADFSVFKRGMAKLLPLRPEDSVTDATAAVSQYIQSAFFPQE